MKKNFCTLFFILFLSLIMLTACGNTQTPDKPDESPVTAITREAATPDVPPGKGAAQGYPGTDNDNTTGYPAPQASGNQAIQAYPDNSQQMPGNVSSEPPDPERSLPAPAEGSGTLGGVLIREVSEGAFTPVTPLNLYLADILEDSKGRQALLSWSEDSPKAELLPTGIFIFNNVTPGTYGLVIDLGFAQFPLTNQDGSELFVTIEAKQALDLGQVFVILPN